jgi:hypothetical protein
VEDTASFAAIISAAVTAVITFLGTWWLTKGDHATKLNLLNNQLRAAVKERDDLANSKQQLVREQQQAKAQIQQLTTVRDKYQQVKSKLEASSVVRCYYQPVILAGPILAGKTSLLMQWHAPWTSAELQRTVHHRISEVPIYDFVEDKKEPHFADPDISTSVNAHLLLQVHDFPGELSAQTLIRAQVEQETEFLRRESRKNLGVVLVCLFNAEEAHTGLSQRTEDYYNGDLFGELRTLVAHKKVALDRLILVFNKYDLLRQHVSPSASDTDLLKLCSSKFTSVLRPLRGVCNPEKVCEVFTVLPRDEMHLKNRGATIVLGEAARVFVETMAGKDVGSQVLSEARATSYSADKFS